MSLERKTVGAIIKEVGDDGSFEAVIATLDVADNDGDVVVAGALEGQTVSVLPAHDKGSAPLGKTTIEERGNLAVAVGKFNLEIEESRDWHSALKFDLANPPSVQEWSWGFNTTKVSFDQRDGKSVRLLEGIELREVSPVVIGASLGTGTIFVKSKDEDASSSDGLWDPAENLRLITEAKLENLDIFAATIDGVRLFPHHFVNEKGQVGAASTRACFSGIVQLQILGARNFNESWRESIYDHLSGHLKSADIEFPALSEKSGTKLNDQILLATWEAETVLARISGISADRELGQEAKAAAMKMAGCHSELMKKLAELAEKMLPDDDVMKAAASFLASGYSID